MPIRQRSTSTLLQSEEDARDALLALTDGGPEQTAQIADLNAAARRCLACASASETPPRAKVDTIPTHVPAVEFSVDIAAAFDLRRFVVNPIKHALLLLDRMRHGDSGRGPDPAPRLHRVPIITHVLGETTNLDYSAHTR